jgi:hypothetical protein
MGINATPYTVLSRAVCKKDQCDISLIMVSHWPGGSGYFLFGKFGNAAVKPVLHVPSSRSETRIRIERAFRGLFDAGLDLPG